MCHNITKFWYYIIYIYIYIYIVYVFLTDAVKTKVIGINVCSNCFIIDEMCGFLWFVF